MDPNLETGVNPEGATFRVHEQEAAGVHIGEINFSGPSVISPAEKGESLRTNFSGFAIERQGETLAVVNGGLTG